MLGPTKHASVVPAAPACGVDDPLTAACRQRERHRWSETRGERPGNKGREGPSGNSAWHNPDWAPPPRHLLERPRCKATEALCWPHRLAALSGPIARLRPGGGGDCPDSAKFREGMAAFSAARRGSFRGKGDKEIHVSARCAPAWTCLPLHRGTAIAHVLRFRSGVLTEI